jgi:glutaredoxin
MVWSFFFGRRRPPRRTDLTFVLYTRRGCHLCEVAWQTLQQARRRYGFTLESVDVDSAEELTIRYGTCVPVVTVNGRLRFRGAVNPVLLQRLLDGP